MTILSIISPHTKLLQYCSLYFLCCTLHSCGLFYNWKIISLNPLHLFHPTPHTPSLLWQPPICSPVSIHFYKDWCKMRNCLNCCIQTMNTAEINGIFMRDLKMPSLVTAQQSTVYRGDSFRRLKKNGWSVECGSMEGWRLCLKDMGSEGQVYSKMWDRRTTEPANFKKVLLLSVNKTLPKQVYHFGWIESLSFESWYSLATE